MRHSQIIHDKIYVKQSETLYLSRVDSITESILAGDVPSDNDIHKLSDSSLNKAIIPSAPVETQAPDLDSPILPKRPTEHHTPDGNLSSYEYIDILFDYTFTSETPICAADMRKRLDENPHVAKKLKQNLRLENFSKLTKLTAKAHTYRNFLIRNGIKL